MPDVDGGKTVRIILRECAVVENGGLSDVWAIEWDIRALCTFLGMTQVGLPLTQAIPPGLSCALIIAESHICIHTWPESASVRVVIDCCVQFDEHAAARWLQHVFDAGRYEIHTV